MKLIFLIAATFSVSFSMRVPPNPCPDMFSYYKDPRGGIYCEALVPYDGSNTLQFSANMSFADIFTTKIKLRAELMNPPSDATWTGKLRYNIYNSIVNVIPRVTELNYNGKTLCSGPPEPLGPKGVTTAWCSSYYHFDSPAFPSFPQINDGSSDDVIPIKDPTSVDGLQPDVTFTDLLDIRKNEGNNNVDTNSNLYNNDQDVTNTYNTQTDQSNIPVRRCETFSVLPRIAGGSKTENGQYPWLVAMLVYQPKTDSFDYKCTGNLISEKHVMTAGRCVQFYKLQIVKTEDILFILGRNDLKDWTNGAITRNAVKVAVHPDFIQNPMAATGDIAIITMDNPVPPSRAIKPVCLWSTPNANLDQIVNKKGTVIGWGKKDNCLDIGGDLNVLHSNYVDMPVISQFQCLKAGPEFFNITSDKTFCAGDRSGRMPCIGDSGAGIVFSIKGAYYLRGIASLSTPSKYAVFCDVAKYVQWVKDNMQ